MLHAHGHNCIQVGGAQVVWMTFHIDAALHVKSTVNVFQNPDQARVEHRCRGAPTDVERGDRATADKHPIPLNLAKDRCRVSFRDGRAIELFVVRTIGTNLVAEGNVKIQPEAIDILEAGPEGDNCPPSRAQLLSQEHAALRLEARY